MNAPANIRPTPGLDLFKTLDERTVLMLIDHLADQLDDDMGDAIRGGLKEAFDALEEGRSYQHCYPAGYPAMTRDHWKRWDDYRDGRLSKLFAEVV